MADEHVLDDGDTKKYWTQIPNIVFELGLKPHELVLYVHLKRAAGANFDGKCTKSTPTLVRETGMGAGTISRAKAALQTKRADLNGKPLIRTRETANPRGGKKRHEIVITDIWKENMGRFASSTVEIEAVGQVPVERDPSSKPISRVEIKKNPLEEEPLKEKGNTPRVRAEGQVKPKLPEHLKPDDDLNATARQELIDFLVQRNPMRPAKIKQQENAIDFMFGTGRSSEQMIRCFQYLKTFWSTAVTWQTVEDQIPNWIEKGEPSTRVNGYAKPEPPRQKTHLEKLREEGVRTIAD